MATATQTAESITARRLCAAHKILTTAITEHRANFDLICSRAETPAFPPPSDNFGLSAVTVTQVQAALSEAITTAEDIGFTGPEIRTARLTGAWSR